MFRFSRAPCENVDEDGVERGRVSSEQDGHGDGRWTRTFAELVCLSHPKAYGGGFGGEEKAGLPRSMSFPVSGNGGRPDIR